MEQEYGIKTKPDSSGNTQANKTIKQIYQVLANLVHTYNLQETYVDDTNPCMGILSAAAFMVRSTYHRTEQKNTGQFFWERHDPTNKSCSKLDTNMSAETEIDRKRCN